jgi:hypothetical protein
MMRQCRRQRGENKMSPHEQMKELDRTKTAYDVTFNFLGFPSVKNAPVLSHSERWIKIQYEGQETFFQICHIARLVVNVI